MYQQHVLNKVTALNQPAGNNMVNIQLSYNINQALELESWDGDFWAISLLSQIRYSLVVILGLNSVSGVQYKDMMIDRWWKVSTGIIDVIKSEV